MKVTLWHIGPDTTLEHEHSSGEIFIRQKRESPYGVNTGPEEVCLTEKEADFLIDALTECLTDILNRSKAA